jgi:predicted permease
VLRYLAACVVVAAVVGRAFGTFARASFHYPARPSDVSAAHRALLGALDVVEWPGLFALTLLVSLLLWRWLRPASLPPVAHGSMRAGAGTFAACLVVALLVILPPTRPEGRPLAAVAAAAMAAVAASLVGRLRAEARAASGPFWRRLSAQLPVVTGHLAATSAASLFLGYRGESALVHGIGLLVGIGLFLGELAWCLLTAALTGVRRAGGVGAGPT